MGRRLATCLFLGFLCLVSLLFLGKENKELVLRIPREAQGGLAADDRLVPDDGLVPDDVMLPFVPRLYESPGEKFDDLKTGKSCVWVIPPKAGEDAGYWHCQDCGMTVEEKCTTLQPKGLCPPFPMVTWDTASDRIHAGDGVRQRSHFRSDAFHNPTSWVTQTMDTKSYYESPVCSPDLTLPCFDLNRCPHTEPMKVYIYNPERTKTLLRKIQQAQEMFPSDIQYTTNHSDACLFVVGQSSFKEKKDMIQNPLWMAGQNHFFVSCQGEFGSHGDRTKPHSYNMEFSATMSASLYDAQVREGYDIVAVMPQVWKRPAKMDTLDVHRPRRLLLSFKGKIERWKLPFEHHRWIASEFWRSEPDVVVDAKCGAEDEYLLEGEEAYAELLLNATFVFAPGGGGVGSYRFTEALAADAIPLIVSHTPLPYSPEVDWSGCVVQISEARIIDAPRILRAISPEEIRLRRERCRTLYRGIYGPTNPLLLALRIWRMRTLQAHRKRDALKGVNELIQNTAVTSTDWRKEGIKEWYEWYKQDPSGNVGKVPTQLERFQNKIDNQKLSHTEASQPPEPKI